MPVRVDSPINERIQSANPLRMNEVEWQTRKRRVDTRLSSMVPAWKIIRYYDGLELSSLHCVAVVEFPTANGPADYALFVNGILLAIIEARKVSVNPQNVLEQAKRYAEGAFQGPGNWNGFRVPFLYATRQQPQDHRGGCQIRLRTRGGHGALPENPYLRGQRPPAQFARRSTRQNLPRRFQSGDDFVKEITGNPNVDRPRFSLSASTGERVRARCRSGTRPSCRIREFRNRPKPKVVVTVDMLSTGVDIPALEFIVFLRPVKSRILWEQMLGRGTRRCNDINKSKFVVFDCFDGTLIRHFRNVSSFDIEPPGRTPLTLPEVIENIWQNVDRDYHVRILAKRLLRIDKDMNAEARTAFAQWITEGDMGRFTKQAAARRGGCTGPVS